MRAATIFLFVALASGIGAAASRIAPSGPTTNEPSAAHNRRLLQVPPPPPPHCRLPDCRPPLPLPPARAGGAPAHPTTSAKPTYPSLSAPQEPPSPAEAEPTLAEVYFNQNGTTLDEAHVWFEEADASGNGLVSYKVRSRQRSCVRVASAGDGMPPSTGGCPAASSLPAHLLCLTAQELEAWMSTQGFTLYSEFHIIFDSYDQDSDPPECDRIWPGGCWANAQQRHMGVGLRIQPPGRMCTSTQRSG